jgi:membrane protein YqaA with SNARE-associated domain
MIERLYNRMMGMAGHDRAPQALFWIAFVESSVFPIPPDVMLIPMVLARRSRAWVYATIATAGSVIGGLAGYAIGYYLFEVIGEPILKLYGYGEKYAQMQMLFDAWGPWILIAKGWTPFPYKVLTIAAGVFKMSLGPFILASIVARALRFYGGRVRCHPLRLLSALPCDSPIHHCCDLHPGARASSCYWWPWQ